MEFHVHLVSDATGETLNAIAQVPHLPSSKALRSTNISMRLFVANASWIARSNIFGSEPGLVFFTLVNPDLRKDLLTQCGQIRDTDL